MGSLRGLSVFAVDPGETTGWAWCCVGRREMEEDPATGGVRVAAKHRSGTLGGDRRVMWGQVPLKEVDPVSRDVLPRWKAENIAAQELAILMLTMRGMGVRASGGVVPEINTLIIEDFILREKTRDRTLLSPVRLTSKIEYAVGTIGELDPELVYQQPSTAKATVTDERLQRWGFWPKGQPHARDALRHLITFMREAKVV